MNKEEKQMYNQRVLEKAHKSSKSMELLIDPLTFSQNSYFVHMYINRV